MFGAIIEAIKLAREAWPKRWSNVEVRFLVQEMGLGFICDDKNMGVIRLTVVDADGGKVCYLEGGNSHTADFVVGFDLLQMPMDLLRECFHMARCFREFERTGNVDYAQGFQHFRGRAVREWMGWRG